MKQTFDMTATKARKSRARAGNPTPQFIKSNRRPFDAVAYAAALEVLG